MEEIKKDLEQWFGQNLLVTQSSVFFNFVKISYEYEENVILYYNCNLGEYYIDDNKSLYENFDFNELNIFGIYDEDYIIRSITVNENIK